MKYIDADKLRALLDEKWRELADKNVKVGGGKWDAEISTYLSVLTLIDSLQQERPEVDLDNEREKYFKGWTETDEGIACHYQYVDLNTCHGIARHFFELGLNVRKEE